MLARVTLIGWVYEKKLDYLEDGTCVFKLVVKTGPNGPNGKNTNSYYYHRVIFFDPTAERALRYDEILDRGSLVYIEGSLVYRTIEIDGAKRKFTSIRLERLRVLKQPERREEEAEIKDFEKRIEKELSLLEETDIPF
ncbi:MAG: single-stranded DNA-binding protein [Thermofilaceae archaeon]